MSHVRRIYFMYQISLLATFVLFEYHHVIIYPKKLKLTHNYNEINMQYVSSIYAK